MKKIIAIIIAVILIGAVYYVFAAQTPDTEFPWGNADITGTGVMNVEFVEPDGTVVDVTPGTNPLAAIFYEGFNVVKVNTFVGVSAVDITTQYPEVELNFRGGTGVGVEFKLLEVSSGTTISDTDHDMQNPAEGYPTIDADGTDWANTMPAVYDLAAAVGNHEGELLLTLTLYGEFRYRGIGAGGTPSDWQTSDVETVVASYTFYAGEDIFTFNWGISGEPQP